MPITPDAALLTGKGRALGAEMFASFLLGLSPRNEKISNRPLSAPSAPPLCQLDLLLSDKHDNDGGSVVSWLDEGASSLICEKLASMCIQPLSPELTVDGAWVRLFGLDKAAQWNGRTAKIIGPMDKGTGRVSVQVKQIATWKTCKLKVKPANLREGMAPQQLIPIIHRVPEQFPLSDVCHFLRVAVETQELIAVDEPDPDIDVHYNLLRGACECLENNVEIIEVVRLLLDLGAAVNQCWSICDGLGPTPLMAAVGSNNLAAVELLLQRGADVDCKDERGFTPLLVSLTHRGTDEILETALAITKLLSSRGADALHPTDDGRTGLVLCAIGNNLPAAKFLIEEQGCGCQLLDSNNPLNMSPVQIGLSKHPLSGYFEKQVALLEKHGAAAFEQQKKVNALHAVLGPLVEANNSVMASPEEQTQLAAVLSDSSLSSFDRALKGSRLSGARARQQHAIVKAHLDNVSTPHQNLYSTSANPLLRIHELFAETAPGALFKSWVSRQDISESDDALLKGMASRQLLEGEDHLTFNPRTKMFMSTLRDNFHSLVVQTLSQHYAFAIPCEAALALIERYAPIVEMGCGSGYWAGLLQDAGVTVVALDKNPPNPTTLSNPYFVDTFCQVDVGEPTSLKDSSLSGHTLLLVWPHSPDHQPAALESWDKVALENFEGEHVIYVGEWEHQTIDSAHVHGSTSSAEFQALMTTNFELVERVAIPQWPDNRDDLTVWRRIK